MTGSDPRLSSPPAPAERADAQQGAAALLTTMVALLIATMVCGVIIAVAQVHRTADDLRAAADAAALAVLSGSPLAGGSGPADVTAGRATAAANGARLDSVDLDHWPLGVLITVQADVAGVGPVAGFPLRATGAARLEQP
ncbi:MAG: hypothetical protein ACR2HR_02400 [Euzebya sp.]